MSPNWIETIQSKVFSYITSNFNTSLLEEFGMSRSNFSTTDSSNKNAVFPFVFIQMIDMSETGETTEANEIEGGLFGIQVDIYDNKLQGRVRNVRTEITRIMKEDLLFKIDSLQPIITTNGVHRGIARYSRQIANMDGL